MVLDHNTVIFQKEKGGGVGGYWGQLKDWVGQVLFLVTCPKGQVEKYVNVKAWVRSDSCSYISNIDIYVH